MPFGQVPVLEVDGSKFLAQSHTIARYLARQHGLAGQNDWEQAQADMYVDCIYDLHGGIHYQKILEYCVACIKIRLNITYLTCHNGNSNEDSHMGTGS